MVKCFLSFFRSIGKESFRQAGFSIASHKLRSFLTLLGIVIGVAPVIALVGIMTGFNEQVTGSFARFGVGVVQFDKLGSANGETTEEEQLKRRDFQIADAQALAGSVKSAKGVSPEARNPRRDKRDVVKNEQGEEANYPTILGVWPSYQQVRNAGLDEGRFFTEADLNHRSRCCVLGASVAKALYPGKTAIGHLITTENARLTVIGALAKRGNGANDSADNVILIPLSTWAEFYPQRFTDNSGVLRIAVAPKNPLMQDDTIDEALTVLRRRRGLKANQDNDFHYWTAESELKSMKRITTAIAGGVILVAAMALLVGGIGVMNIMLVSVTERTREIGVRKALGATKLDILAQFLIETVTVTSLGGLLGLGLGMGVALLVRLLTPLPASAPLWSAALGMGVSTMVGLAFGLWPAMKAASLDPIEALRYE